MRDIEITKPQLHSKEWGNEEWIDNNTEYCGKILRMKKGSSFSMHFHLLKRETWFLYEGSMRLDYFNLETAKRESKILNAGSVVKIPRGKPHKIYALSECVIFEVSTQHFEFDSYRIEAGDSQNNL